MGEVTLLIAQAREGDRAAFDRIFELMYPELRSIAHRRLARHARHGAFDTTALVNECYLKFVQRQQLVPADRAHFLAYSATVMRSIIVDAARSAQGERHGGGIVHVTLDTHVGESVSASAEQILDVDEALKRLAQVDARLASVVEMRYFAGMTDLEIAETLGLTDRTVRRDWEKARLLLAHALRH
ncbi:MAG: ECF-type sigma factor [Betaproteobacteria bacterium]